MVAQLISPSDIQAFRGSMKPFSTLPTQLIDDRTEEGMIIRVSRNQ